LNALLITRAALAGVLTGLLAPSVPASAAAELRFVVGGSGWLLERFEGDIVVLRTNVAAPGAGRPGMLMLSCAGAERRVRLALPGYANLGAGAVRPALIRPVGSPASLDKPLLASLALDQGRLLTFSEIDSGQESVVLGLARLLAQKPAALDILTHRGAGAISFRKLVPTTLVLTFGGHDGVALDHFVAACLPAAR